MTRDENGGVDPRFSAAAENALDEAIDDIRQEVTRRANFIANGPQGGNADVGVRDVIQALSEVSGRDSLLRRRLRLVRLATFTYGALGVLFLIFYYTQDYRSFDSAIPLMSGILMGSALTPLLLLAFDAMSPLRRNDGANDSPSNAEYSVLNEWIKLESTIRARYSDQFGESRANVSIGKMIHDLSKAGALKERDIERVMRLLAFRNSIAHGKFSDLSDMSASEARDLIHSARVVRNRLRET